MSRRKFKLSHSILGLVVLIAIQGILAYLYPVDTTAWLILAFSLVGAVVTLYVATEVVEEVRRASSMVRFLCAVVAEFVIFFAFEYWFLIAASPASFPTLPHDAVSVLLHSMMIFVFNPIHLPADTIGSALLLINTGSAIGLVLFILQNIPPLRRPLE